MDHINFFLIATLTHITLLIVICFKVSDFLNRPVTSDIPLHLVDDKAQQYHAYPPIYKIKRDTRFSLFTHFVTAFLAIVEQEERVNKPFKANRRVLKQSGNFLAALIDPEKHQLHDNERVEVGESS